MTRLARELLASARKTLAPAENDNRLVPLIASGQAPRSVFATIAAEETRIVRSDWRSFLTIAARCTKPPCAPTSRRPAARHIRPTWPGCACSANRPTSSSR